MVKLAMWVIVILVLLNVLGCATAEQIGLGFGRTLQAAGGDAIKIVEAVSD